jgi:hypothetical protein
MITFHSLRSYPLFQANRWDWRPHRKLGTKYLVVLCVGSTLLLAEDTLTRFVVKRRPCWSVTRLSSITFSHLFAPLLIDIPWFLNWGKTLLLYSSHLPLGVPNGLVIQLGTNSFLAPSTSNQCGSNFACGRAFVNRSATFRSMCTLPWLYHHLYIIALDGNVIVYVWMWSEP